MVARVDFQLGSCTRRVAHTCTDNSNLLSLDIDILRRPERGVVDDSLELLHALVIRNISLSSKASGDDEESCLAGTSISSLYSPLSGLLVKFCRGHNGLERSVFAQIADFVTVVEVGLQFPPAWVVCGKAERVVDLGNRQLVDWDRAVDSSSWVAVPSPNYSDSCQSFVSLKFVGMHFNWSDEKTQEWVHVTVLTKCHHIRCQRHKELCCILASSSHRASKSH